MGALLHVVPDTDTYTDCPHTSTATAAARLLLFSDGEGDDGSLGSLASSLDSDARAMLANMGTALSGSGESRFPSQ